MITLKTNNYGINNWQDKMLFNKIDFYIDNQIIILFHFSEFLLKSRMNSLS